MSEGAPANTITAVGVVLDCADPVGLADFWQAAVGFTVRTGAGEPYVTLSGSEMRRPLNHLTLQRVPESKGPKNRMHIDLWARDGEAEVARLIALGATETRREPAGSSGDDLLMCEMADPEGNEFCVIHNPKRA